MRELTEQSFDAELAESQDLTCVFFWGHDCPNCEVAKAMMMEKLDEVRGVGLRWFHVNTYHHFALGTRFGLFGIPTFLFFRDGRRLGKISPFPGIDPFIATLKDLKNGR